MKLARPLKATEVAAIPAPEPPKAETQVKPELDTVRVESDGQAVVAGRAKPGAEVSLKLGDQVIGKGIGQCRWILGRGSRTVRCPRAPTRSPSSRSQPIRRRSCRAIHCRRRAGTGRPAGDGGAVEAGRAPPRSCNRAKTSSRHPQNPERLNPPRRNSRRWPRSPPETEQQPAEAQPPVEGTVAEKAPEGSRPQARKRPATTEQAEQPPAAVAEAKPEDIEAKPAQAAPPKAEPAEDRQVRCTAPRCRRLQ